MGTHSTGSEDRLQHAVDRVEILEVLSRYAVGMSIRDLDVVASCFTESIELDYVGLAQLDGLDEVRDYLSRTFAPGRGASLASTPLHANTMVEIDGDRAHAVTVAAVFHRKQRNGLAVVVGRGVHYTDDLERGSDGWGWRIGRRVHRNTWEFEASATELQALDQTPR